MSGGGSGESAELRAAGVAGPLSEGAAATLNDGVTGDGSSQLAWSLNLRATPNPFNPATEIRFDLARRGQAELRIFDVSGRLVQRLGGEMMEAGENALRWNGTDLHGEPVVSGVYFYRLFLDGADLGNPQRMTLLK